MFDDQIYGSKVTLSYLFDGLEQLMEAALVQFAG